MLKSVKKTRISDEIVQQIYQLVRDGTLKPGDRLPPERDLAQQLNVSRSSVRESMRSLDTRGLIVVKPGAGTFITDEDVETIIHSFSALVSNEDTAIDNVFEMSLLLEPHVAFLSAQRSGESDIRRMKEILESQAVEIAGGGNGTQFDPEFHIAVANSTKNSALIASTRSTSDIMNQGKDFSHLSLELSHQSLQSLGRILAAIETSRPEEARDAMHQHITEFDRHALNLP